MDSQQLITKFLEFAKWAVPAIGGFAVLKLGTDAIKDRRWKKLMQLQIYQEMIHNYQNIVELIAVATSVEGLRQGTAHRFDRKLDLRFDIWNYYSSDANAGIYRLREANALHAVFGKFAVIGNVPDAYEAMTKSREAAAEFDEQLSAGAFDSELLRAVSPKVFWPFLEDLIKGKRESHKRFLNPF